MKLHLLPLVNPVRSIALIFSFLSAWGGIAPAQDAVPMEEAQKIARKLNSMVVVVSDLPFAVDADSERPAGLKGGDAGVIILPDRHLTAEAVAGAGKVFVPVGQLWSHKVALISGGSGFASDRLRSLTVGEGEKSREVQLYFLGIIKNEQGNLELAVFGKGKEPLCRVALRKIGAGSQDLPIELSGQKTGEEAARLTLSLAGQFTADLDVIKSE